MIPTTAPAQTSYTPSRRFASIFVPLIIATSVVAVVMAYVLLLAERHDLYYYFVVPLLVGSPVLAGVAAAVHLGKCRNPRLAMIVGLAMPLLFYAGYWQVSYLQFRDTWGKELSSLLLKSQTGSDKVWGYFLFRCQVTKPASTHEAPSKNVRPPTGVDRIFNYVFFGGEAAMLGFIGLGIGAALSRRAFFDAQERWATSCSFQLAAKDAQAATAAIAQEDWPVLAALPKMAHDATAANASAFRVKLEFLPGMPQVGVYLTAWLGNAGKSTSGAFRFLDRVGTGTIRQRLISGDSAVRLCQALPAETKYNSAAAPAFTVRAASASATTEPPADPIAIRDASALPRSSSLRTVAGGICQAVQPEEHKRVRRYQSVFTFFILGTLVLAMGAALWGVLISRGQGDGDPMTPTQIVAFSIFGGGMLAMLIVIFAFHPLHSVWMRKQLTQRPGSLLGSPSSPHGRVYSVYFAHLFHLKNKETDDVAIVAADAANHRLLVEGLRYRYSIPASAIRSITPLQSDSTLAIEIDFLLAGQHELKLVLARENMKAHWQHHIGFISAAGDAAKAAEKLRKQLGVSPAPAVVG